MPYTFEVVKAQSSSGDESRFYTELSRAYMQQHKPTSTLWTVPPPQQKQPQDTLQERRKAPQVIHNLSFLYIFYRYTAKYLLHQVYTTVGLVK